jgi:hypothetical protein
LIGSGFFGYAREIIAHLERGGRKVLWFEDRPATDNTTKALLRIAPRLLRGKADAFFADVTDRIRNEAIVDVLVIKGEALSVESIRRLREALPEARFTLYFWDGYRNMPKDSPGKVSLFDRAFTFDPVDAEADQRLRYRPLFFLDEYAQLSAQEQDIDLLFLGTAHTDRYPVLKRLQRALPEHLRFERILYFPSQAVYRTRRILDWRLRGARRDEFVFSPLNKTAILGLVSRARTIVDIERAAQTGLTMRTLEALGAGRKLVTTNPRVLQAEFYNPNNVAVIDRAHPVIAAGFFEFAYTPPPADMLRRYSLSGWIQEVLSGRP